MQYRVYVYKSIFSHTSSIALELVGYFRWNYLNNCKALTMNLLIHYEVNILICHVVR